MTNSSTKIKFVLLIVSILLFQNCQPNLPENWQWKTIEAKGAPTPRHEAGFVAYKDKLYLIGGRRINPTSVFDTKTNTWEEKSPTPIEIHHFQPVVYGDAIYLMGAMTGQWPNETPLEQVIIYYPKEDKYVYGDTIPTHRRRGGAGTAVYNDKIYMVGGITNGHMNGYQPWFDEYNPKTGQWKTLPDAPNARDHFQAVAHNDKLYAFAGRRTSKATNQDMALTVSHGNIFDFKTRQWEAVTNQLKIPTKRAGNSAFVWNDNIIIGGGESEAHKVAHNEVEAFNTKTQLWSKYPSLQEGRHGTGLAIIGNYVYTASGCGNRGGEPELLTIERLELPEGNPKPISKKVDNRPIHMQWHTVELAFEGEKTSEDDEYNPFLNYRLTVEFKHTDTEKTIRGFYATDGNAAETSAKIGNIWKVRFTPDQLGEWSYTATLHKDEDIALSDDLKNGKKVSISNAKGKFLVIPSDKDGADFRSKGRIVADNGFFKFQETDKYWLKVGANSPENFLAYVDFDDTYRMKQEAREGEATAVGEIHSFTPHLKDWKTGDPTWKNGKGKSIIGAVNYLASKSMTSIYFLTMNIGGDGKDVWMYASPDDFTRFDVSKLAQWEIVFQHMESKGIMLHIVTQETENEKLLDGGDTGKHRKLYYRELVARFGHHLGLVWNLGEENGPASWTPIAQNDQQRKAMAKTMKQIDLYNHPVLLHTHSDDHSRDVILDSLLGYEYLDGLSFQQAIREETNDRIALWKKKSKNANHNWLISMDEIGMWYDGALTDTEDPNHSTLIKNVLWGSLMSGAVGVEWYFGAKHPHNDLNSEDWRQRERLWELTNHAKDFFQNHLPYWEMQPEQDLVSSKNALCFVKKGEVYAIYLPKGNKSSLDLTGIDGEFSVSWYNPLTGGELEKGTVEIIQGGSVQVFGVPMTYINQDWVVLVRKME